jgi:hypothetical protein
MKKLLLYLQQKAINTPNQIHPQERVLLDTLLKLNL